MQNRNLIGAAILLAAMLLSFAWISFAGRHARTGTHAASINQSNLQPPAEFPQPYPQPQDPQPSYRPSPCSGR